MICVVTGCSGFIGSHLTDKLLSLGYTVIGIDNFSTGKIDFLNAATKHKNFTLMYDDLLTSQNLKNTMRNVDIVFHLAANADVRFGPEHTRRDLEQNTIVTSNVLEAMRINGVKKIAFSSTGSIYGECKIVPTPEDAPFPIQTSLYGASKLAAEGLIQAYAEAFDMRAYIFRFVSILGERYTHGHIFDFYHKLLGDPTTLNVLGNGKQKKSYLYVHDCIDAILLALNCVNEKINIFNLGTDEYCEVNDSIKWITEYLDVSPEISYTGGDRGWIGDNPFIFLDCSKIRNLGWKPKLSIRSAVIETVRFLQQYKTCKIASAFKSQNSNVLQQIS